MRAPAIAVATTPAPDPVPLGDGEKGNPAFSRRIANAQTERINQAWQTFRRVRRRTIQLTLQEPRFMQTASPNGTQYRYRFTLRRDQTAAAGELTYRPQAGTYGCTAPWGTGRFTPYPIDIEETNTKNLEEPHG